MNNIRTAIVPIGRRGEDGVVRRGATLQEVRRYLPSNYQAAEANHVIVIQGEDNAGWTLDGYVIPRLASGLIFAEEAKFTEGES